MTVSQLTGVCKDIQEGKRDVSFTSRDDGTTTTGGHHPFAVKEAPAITIRLVSKQKRNST